MKKYLWLMLLAICILFIFSFDNKQRTQYVISAVPNNTISSLNLNVDIFDTQWTNRGKTFGECTFIFLPSRNAWTLTINSIPQQGPLYDQSMMQTMWGISYEDIIRQDISITITVFIK